MSLQYAAQHLAAKGRGPDTMLVHMAPGEVRGLQAIAMAHGGSLSINPETGLPEAGFLSSILPMIVGAALAPMTAGTSLAFLGTPLGAGLATGAVTGLATGSLQKGLMAGLGAYGGAGLAGSIASAGTGAISSGAGTGLTGADFVGQAASLSDDAAAMLNPGTAVPASTTSAIPSAAALSPDQINLLNTQFGVDPSVLASSGASPVSAVTPAPMMNPNIVSEATQERMLADRLSAATPTDKFKAGLSAIADKPSLLLNKDNLKYGLSAAAPMLAATPTMRGLPTDSNARIRDYVYDPISGTYEYIGARTPSEVAEQGPIRRAANGGVMRYANEGLVQEGSNPTEEQLKSVSDLYGKIGRTGDAEGVNYWANRLAGGESLNDLTNAFNASAQYVQQQQQPLASAAPAAAAASAPPVVMDTGTSAPAAPSADQLRTVTDIYRNTLGRDPDAEGLNYWAGRLAQGESLPDVYSALQGSARYVLGNQADQLAPRLGSTLEQATTPYTGFKSADATSIGDEWVRNLLGREATAADRSMPWYQSLGDLTTTGDTTTAYNKFLETYGLKKSQAPSWFEASQLRAPAPRKTPATTGMMPGYTFNDSGIGSGLTRPEEPAGKTTDWKPGSAGIPTMQDVVNAYTQGGGLTGRLPYVPRSLAEQEQLYNRMTGETKRAYDYLMGRGAYPRSPATAEIMRPYGEAVLGLPAGTYNQKYIFDPRTQRYMPNPNYKAPVDPGAAAKAKAEKEAPAEGFVDMGAMAAGGSVYGYADGGLSHLGDYSDGGRLLKGPGDGVSDSIPATIGDKRPARLADGEFVVPARIVSELGNGSTDAGARKLYAMMNRIQSNRRKSVGKGKVAVNSKSDKYLPA